MKNNEQPTAPQNFDHVPRYVSGLPVDRVEHIRNKALVERKDAECMRRLEENTRETDIIEMLCGYLIELSEPNK